MIGLGSFLFACSAVVCRTKNLGMQTENKIIYCLGPVLPGPFATKKSRVVARSRLYKTIRPVPRASEEQPGENAIQTEK